MKIYDYAIFYTDKVNLDGNNYGIIFGKHEFYIPEIEEKFIYSVRGRIVSYGKCKFKDELLANGLLLAGKTWDEKYLNSIVNEYSLLKYLGDMKMSPPVGELIFIKKVFSTLNDFGILDEVGMFGYEMRDANSLPMGKWSVDIVNEMVEQGLIKASPGAKNDLTNIDRKNLINGYCVDVRRSFRDDLPYYNNFLFDGETAKIWGEINEILGRNS